MNNTKWLIAAILTFITILSWVVFDIIHSRSEVQIPENLQNIIEPISPNFDTSALQAAP